MRHTTGRLTCLLALVLASLLSIPALADDDAENPESDPQLIEQLKALSKTTGEIKDLSAQFQQWRYSPLLKKPLHSQGRIRSVPGLTRWDTDKPGTSTMLVKPDRLELYDPEQDTLEVYPIEKRFGQLLANPRPAVGDWLRQFSLQRADAQALSEQMRLQCRIDEQPEACLLVRLTPKDDELAQMIAQLFVVLDVKSGLTRGMAWTSGEQELTELVFSKTRVDTGLEADELRLSLPDSARVVYPLGPIPDPEQESD